MAKPRTQVEQRLDKLEERLDNVHLAVGMMAQWLVQAQTGFGAHDAEGIERILRGEKKKETEDDAS